MTRCAVFLLILIAFPSALRPQEHEAQPAGSTEETGKPAANGSTQAGQLPAAAMDSVEEVHPLLEALAMFALPKILQDGVLFKEYLRSEEFRGVRETDGDQRAVDVLFRRALRMCWNNPYSTLVIVLAAVLDHRRVGVRVPLFGPLIWIPLTSEFPGDFAARRAALPSRMFADSPAWGDRDKLQHFFGSALAAALTESEETAARVGEFVEWGEDMFIVEGTVESRDSEANRRGARFGLALLRDRSVLPSAFMRAPLHMQWQDSLDLHQENTP
ncbi:MAG: hypothetical protein IT282_02260 [Bacteroidetes bacterium]|nr:hypothetical protein [Bacteroidota bacterium]